MVKSRRRSRALGLRWIAVVSVGIGVPGVACSSDDAPPDEPTGGSAGKTGNPQAGEGGSGGAAGSEGAMTMAGTPPMVVGGAGGAAGGEGGAGGSGGEGGWSDAALGARCLGACGYSQCGEELQDCNHSDVCLPWLNCFEACDSAACIAACDEAHADGARVYRNLYSCLCDSCDTECTGANACEKTTCVDDDVLPPITAAADGAPATLAETGLYALEPGDGEGGAGGGGGASSVDLVMPIALAPYVKTFEPKYPLWADGATKSRYIYIPKCSTIDTSDMDHWKFPVGTRLWKTFTVGQTVVETRFLHRFGPANTDWMYAAYQWDASSQADPSRAMLTNGQVVPNANGTTHDIPSHDNCVACHSTGIVERVLGFSAIQLSHDGNAAGDLTIKKLSDMGWLTVPAPEGFEVPGTPVQQAALGYMHGNCGGCHNDIANIPNGNPQILRLSVGQMDYLTSDPVVTTVNVAAVNGGIDRIEPMNPDASRILQRMLARGTAAQMPPLNTNSTKMADTNGGVKVVTDWINSIPQ